MNTTNETIRNAPDEMKRFFVVPVFFFLLTTFPVFAGSSFLFDQKIDSLSQLLATSKDAQKAEIYFSLAKLTYDNLPYTSFDYMEQALRLSIKSNNSFVKAKIRLLMGNYFSSRRKFTLALENYVSAQRIFSDLGDSQGTMEALAEIGRINIVLTNYSISIDYFSQGLTLARRVGDFKMAGIFQENIGVCYQNRKNFKEARIQYDQALDSYHAARDVEGTIRARCVIGSLLLEFSKYDEAIAFYKDLLKQIPEGFNSTIGTVYTRIAHSYSQKGDYAQSLMFDKKALEIRQINHQKEEGNSSMINVAGDYFNLHQLDSAWKYYNLGYRLATYFNRKNLIQNSYRTLVDYYSGITDFEKALDAYQKYLAIGDSIILEKNQSNLDIIKAGQRRHSIDDANSLLSKQNEIQQLKIRNQRIQIIFIQILMFFAVILILVYFWQFLYNSRSRRKIQELNQKLSKEIKEREKIQIQLRHREQQYRFLAENSLDFITRVGKDNKRIYASPSSMKVHGYTMEEILDKTPFDLAHPDFVGYAEGQLKELIRERSSRQLIYLARKKDGSYFWAESLINPIYDPDTGEFQEFVGVTRDIQERKSKEIEIMEGTKQKENLLKEIHHRVKNNFAILVSLINMQKDQTNDPELLQSLTNLQLRIRTMSLVHEMLYRSKDFEQISFADYLRSLSSVIAGTYNRRDIRITYELEESILDIESAIPLGLMVNEILTNAYKHAFPENRPGNIYIRLKTRQDLSAECLTISDDGIGLSAGFSIESCTTMGLQIVQILVKQIEATLTISSPPGTQFSISFPKIMD